MNFYNIKCPHCLETTHLVRTSLSRFYNGCVCGFEICYGKLEDNIYVEYIFIHLPYLSKDKMKISLGTLDKSFLYMIKKQPLIIDYNINKLLEPIHFQKIISIIEEYLLFE